MNRLLKHLCVALGLTLAAPLAWSQAVPGDKPVAPGATPPAAAQPAGPAGAPNASTGAGDASNIANPFGPAVSPVPAPPAAAAAAPAAKAFLWQVKSKTNTVYLFGTVHVGKNSFYPPVSYTHLTLPTKRIV